MKGISYFHIAQGIIPLIWYVASTSLWRIRFVFKLQEGFKHIFLWYVSLLIIFKSRGALISDLEVVPLCSLYVLCIVLCCTSFILRTIGLSKQTLYMQINCFCCCYGYCVYTTNYVGMFSGILHWRHIHVGRKDGEGMGYNYLYWMEHIALLVLSQRLIWP